MLGNPKTDMLYVIIFEAPQAEWTEAWRWGRVITTHILLNGDL